MMVPLIICSVGAISCIITLVLTRKIWPNIIYNIDVPAKMTWRRTILISLVSISVTTLGAGVIPITDFEISNLGIGLIIVIFAILTIVIYACAYEYFRFETLNKRTKCFFFVITLISSVCWGKYSLNFEIVKEIKESKQEKEVVYFSIRDSNINCLCQNGETEYYCISIDDAKVDVDDNIDKAYVEIYSHIETKKIINNNNGKEEITNEWEIREYSFHLNGEVMK